LDDLLDLVGGKHASLATMMVIVSDGDRGCDREHTTSRGSPAKRQYTTTADGHTEIKTGHKRSYSRVMDGTRPGSGRER
jgi:hypothetical protein